MIGKGNVSGGQEKPSASWCEGGGYKLPLPILSILEEGQGPILQAGILTYGHKADYSGGSVRDSHPLPFSSLAGCLKLFHVAGV